MHLPTRTLQIRDPSPAKSHSHSSSSNPCSGKHKNDASCEKPANSDSLEIGLGVAIPVAVIMLILGVFLFRNYRKEKKESLEHDPDFDENGDATALPDFPAFTKEGAFDKRGSSVRMNANPGYPLMNLPNLSNADSRSMNSSKFKDSTESSQRRIYPDAFVLPHQNQIGSKASLDEFAKNSIDNREFARSFRRDSDQFSSPTPGFNSERTSPQKSALRNGNVTTSPLKKKTNAVDYTNLPNTSTSSFNTAFGGTDASSDEKPHRNQFGVEYENESDLAINSTLPSSNMTGRNAFDTDSELESVEDDESVETHKDLARAEDEIKQSIINSSADTTRRTQDHSNSEPGVAAASVHSERSAVVHPDNRANVPKINVPDDDSEENDVDTVNSKNMDSFNVSSPFEDKHEVQENVSVNPSSTTQLKEPRISQFDMLRNVSDDEEDEKEKLTDEQREELARMKSVYKVYFDRTNSVISEKRPDSNGGHQFQADTSQPMPNLDIDNLRINSNLKGDTKYDKRLTTASSVYEDFNTTTEENYQQHEQPGANGQPKGALTYHQFQQQQGPNVPAQYPHQQYHPQQQQFHPYPQQQQQQRYNEGYFPQFNENGEPVEATSPQDMVPLKSLPHASDIRNSTIETFTNYQPRVKITSPGVKPSSHFEDSLNSPQISQSSFGSYNGGSSQDLPPVINNVYGSRPTPSASQLSRTSVVMLNPVNEITSSRKFKPAGSLPSGIGNAGYNNENFSTEDDLIPGNRKSAVRRMMNTNF